MIKTAQATLSRRTFLFAAAAGAATTAAALIALKKAPVQATPDSQSRDSGGGYQLTEHVRNYYRSAQI